VTAIPTATITTLRAPAKRNVQIRHRPNPAPVQAFPTPSGLKDIPSPSLSSACSKLDVTARCTSEVVSTTRVPGPTVCQPILFFSSIIV
jgi:hypothetical protein